MKNKRLILFTNSFPFGSAEKSFIIPELPYLQKHFDLTIVSAASKEDVENKKLETKLDKSISLLHYGGDSLSKIEEYKGVLPFFLHKESWKELFCVLNSRKMVLERIKFIINFYTRAVKLRKWMEQNNLLADENSIYYSYWYIHRVLSLVMAKQKYPDLKIITRAHGYDLYKEQQSLLWQPFKQYMDMYINQIVFVCEQGYTYYQKYFSASGNYCISRLGTHNKGICDPRDKELPFLLVSCSYIDENKRVDLIIEALAHIDDCNIHWAHFGTGTHSRMTIEYADRLLAEKNNVTYEFKGYTPNNEIMDYYRAQKPACFILLSKSEGSPVAMQEAISFGVPVIGTKAGGIPEMIHGNGVLLSENPTYGEVANAIRTIYQLSPTEFKKMQVSSLEIWKQSYNRDKNMSEFINILNGLG